MGAGEADRGKRGRQGQARLMGASEAGGGRRDRWGQARPMGAVSRRAKSIVNTPPLAQGFPNEGRQNRRNKRKSEILLRVPNPIKSNKNPNIQCKSKYTISNKGNPKIQILPMILSGSNILHTLTEFNSPEGHSESVCQHLRTCHVLDLDLAFGNGFMNRVVPES